MPKMRLLSALAVVALLGACSHTPDTATTSGAGSAATGTTTTQRAVPGSQDDLAQNVGDRVLYATDSSQLSDEARATLDRQAAWLAQYPQNQIQLAGNCDERGTTEFNLALGQRRSNAARDYLVARGVSAARITTVSYGKDRPTALGSDESAWSQNRNAITSVAGAPTS